MAVAFFQLRRFNSQVQADFTYKVYRDLQSWLGNHSPAKLWFDKPDGTSLGEDHYDAWEIDELLTYFETVWSLWRADLVDKEMVYDLLSDDVISIYEANSLELDGIIRTMRTEEQDAGDIFIGVEHLYHVMKQMTAAKNQPPRSTR